MENGHDQVTMLAESLKVLMGLKNDQKKNFYVQAFGSMVSVYIFLLDTYIFYSKS